MYPCEIHKKWNAYLIKIVYLYNRFMQWDNYANNLPMHADEKQLQSMKNNNNKKGKKKLPNNIYINIKIYKFCERWNQSEIKSKTPT